MNTIQHYLCGYHFLSLESENVYNDKRLIVHRWDTDLFVFICCGIHNLQLYLLRSFLLSSVSYFSLYCSRKGKAAVLLSSYRGKHLRRSLNYSSAYAVRKSDHKQPELWTGPGTRGVLFSNFDSEVRLRVLPERYSK